jgi:small redox-active disulfide protein 2
MTMEIRVLGPGCANCQTLLQNTKEAVAALGLDANVKEIHDVMEIARRGVLSTPALVVNDMVVMAGHVMSVPSLQKLLSDFA